MTTTTQITNIAHLLDLTDYAGDYIADYDMAAVHADYLKAIQRELPAGITLHANGDVIATLARADRARGLHWRALANSIDVAPIFERHDRTAR